MMRNCLLAGIALFGDLADRKRLVTNESENLLALWCGERLEDLLGGHALRLPPVPEKHKHSFVVTVHK